PHRTGQVRSLLIRSHADPSLRNGGQTEREASKYASYGSHPFSHSLLPSPCSYHHAPLLSEIAMRPQIPTSNHSEPSSLPSRHAGFWIILRSLSARHLKDYCSGRYANRGVGALM